MITHHIRHAVSEGNVKYDGVRDAHIIDGTAIIFCVSLPVTARNSQQTW